MLVGPFVVLRGPCRVGWLCCVSRRGRRPRRLRLFGPPGWVAVLLRLFVAALVAGRFPCLLPGPAPVLAARRRPVGSRCPLLLPLPLLWPRRRGWGRPAALGGVRFLPPLPPLGRLWLWRLFRLAVALPGLGGGSASWSGRVLPPWGGGGLFVSVSFSCLFVGGVSCLFFRPSFLLVSAALAPPLPRRLPPLSPPPPLGGCRRCWWAAPLAQMPPRSAVPCLFFRLSRSPSFPPSAPAGRGLRAGSRRSLLWGLLRRRVALWSGGRGAGLLCPFVAAWPRAPWPSCAPWPGRRRRCSSVSRRRLALPGCPLGLAGRRRGRAPGRRWRWPLAWPCPWSWFARRPRRPRGGRGRRCLWPLVCPGGCCGRRPRRCGCRVSSGAGACAPAPCPGVGLGPDRPPLAGGGRFWFVGSAALSRRRGGRHAASAAVWRSG